MKHKSALILMEQLVMLLVFALGAAACLGIFAKAHAVSTEIGRRDQAVLLAQNAAERLKAGQEPEPSDAGALTLTVQPQQSGVPGLAAARIQVFYEESLLFTLDTGWQEGSP